MPLAAVLFSLAQPARYRASSEVLLSYQNLGRTLSGTAPTSSVVQDPKRIAETQARIARTPAVASGALRVTHVRDRTVDQFLRDSNVSADPNADVLEFRVDDGQRAIAVRLATAYAAAFTRFTRTLETSAVARARQGVERRIQRLEQSGDRHSALYGNLVAKEQQLSALQALQTSNAAVVRPADEATQIQPRPVRNALLALILALIVAGSLVALARAFDTRVRDAQEASEWLGLPLLARLPDAPRPLRKSDRLVMLAEPYGSHAEQLRLLKTQFEFAVLASEAQTILVTSSAHHEGKSTTAANLAIALYSGRRVVLVDLDLRRPMVHRFFGLPREPGLTDAVLDRTALDSAIVPVRLDDSGPVAYSEAIDGERVVVWPATWPSPQRGQRKGDGVLQVMPAGRAVSNISELVDHPGFDALLTRLRARADIVLFDAPPVLHAPEALALTRKVDALLVVVRSGMPKRETLGELGSTLDPVPAAKLGFVFTGVPTAEAYEGYRYPRSPASTEHQPVA
jgi:Mrp family chromosome partitioning ATPase/capsular polysaccharide biosynthesis protein